MNIIQELESVGSVYTDKHFVYASGKHGSGYINMDPLFTQIELGRQVGDLLIEPFRGEFVTVAGPATGGIVLVQWAASAASTAESPVASVWADKIPDKQFDFERSGFKEQIAGKKVLVVEDLLTTGGSVEKVCRLVEKYGGELVGVSVVCNRGGVTSADLGVQRLEALANVSFDILDPESCELCANKVPIVEDLGHGDSYRESNPDYPGGYIRLLQV